MANRGLYESMQASTRGILGLSFRVREAWLCDLLENGYTAVETLFLRISQAFENHLDSRRWHADLMEKMTLEVPKIRPDGRVTGEPGIHWICTYCNRKTTCVKPGFLFNDVSIPCTSLFCTCKADGQFQ